MQLGLYSALARGPVRAARDFIAERGYGHCAGDIRRCRQDLIGLDRWHAFETETPQAFVNMYQFWVQKPASGAVSPTPHSDLRAVQMRAHSRAAFLRRRAARLPMQDSPKHR